MTDNGESTEIATAFNDLAQAFVAKGTSPLLVSGAMVTALIGLVEASGISAKAAAMLRTIAERIDPSTMILEP